MPGSLPRFVEAGAVLIFGEVPDLWSRGGEGDMVGGSFTSLNVLIRPRELSDVVACEMWHPKYLHMYACYIYPSHQGHYVTIPFNSNTFNNINTSKYFISFKCTFPFHDNVGLKTMIHWPTFDKWGVTIIVSGRLRNLSKNKLLCLSRKGGQNFAER